jgi:hypothetical protein
MCISGVLLSAQQISAQMIPINAPRHAAERKETRKTEGEKRQSGQQMVDIGLQMADSKWRAVVMAASSCAIRH